MPTSKLIVLEGGMIDVLRSTPKQAMKAHFSRGWGHACDRLCVVVDLQGM